MLTIGINQFLELIRRAEEIAEWIKIQRDAGRDKEASDELEKICRQEVGLPFSVVQHSSPEQISELLHQGINSRERSILLAELLILEAELKGDADDAVGQIRAQLQAFCLLGKAIEMLNPDDRAICRPKLDKLARQLHQAGDDPYLAGKLRRFGY